MKKTIFVITLLTFLSAHRSFALIDGNDTIYLNKVTVKEKLPLFKIYSLKAGLSPTDQLWLNAPLLNVKKYGINGITSLSINGLPARFTTTSWEGIPLNSVMSGDLNFSVLPLFPGSQIELTGGLLNSPYTLNFSQPEDEYWILKLSSAQNFNTYLSKSFTSNNNHIKITANTYYNTNRYKVLNDYVSPPEIKKLANYPSIGRFAGISDKITLSKRWYLKVAGLYLFDGKKIIPPVFKDSSHENISYEIYGFNALSNSNFGILSYQLKYAFSKQFLLYTDSLKNIFSHNNSYLNEVTQKVTLKLTPELTTSLTTLFKSEKAVTSNYISEKIRNTYHITPSAVYHKSNFDITLNGSLILSPFSPLLTYNAIVESKLTKSLGYAILYGKNVKLPTLNDLYWYQGGNPELEPEILHSITLRFYAGNNRNLSLDFSHSVIENEIMWMPVNGSVIWQPVNITQSYRKSLSASYAGAKKIGKYTIKTTNSFTYTSAKDTAGNFLIFIPKFKFSSATKLIFNERYFISVDYTYYGKRYITTSNTASLPAFNLINTAFGFRYHSFLFAFTVNNLLNANYAFIQSNPMPLRYVEFSAKYLFNHKSKKL